MKAKIYSLIAMTTLLLLASCSRTENSKVEYIPFQETEDGQWGMISMDGKVLFSEEFKSRPTVVRDGRFFVRSKEGVWEMYDATDKPQKIGGEYAHTSGFRNGRALVAKKNEPVSIIDTEGNTIKVIDKIDGLEVDGVRIFNGGYAVFMTTDSLFGVIDNSGECVVKPEYVSLNDHGDGKFIGVNKRYKDNLKKGKKDKVKISVVDTSGKVLLDISGDKYEDMHNAFVDGLLPVSVKKDGKESWGIINDKGETVVKPATKIKNIGEINGDKFTYNNGDGWGLMNIKGETLIRAKYESLYYDSDDRLIALVKNGGTVEYKYIDTKDNQIGTETYVVATFFSMFDGQHALVKPNDKIFSIIDKKGNQIDGLPDIVDVGIFEGELYIESDYVDIAKFVSELKITEEGVFGLTYTSSAQDGVAIQVKQGNARSTDEHKAGTPYWYDYSDEISFDANANTRIFIGYTGKLSKQDFRNERVIDYTIGDWYYYHDEKIPTGYSWNNVTPTMFLVRVTNDGRMHGKLRDIFKALSEKFKKYGTVAKQNNGAIVVEMKNGTRAEIIMEKDCVLAFWGKLLQDAEDIDIDEYKDASEEDDGENISYGYLSQLFPGKKNIYIEDVDSVAVDTVVAD